MAGWRVRGAAASGAVHHRTRGEGDVGAAAFDGSSGHRRCGCRPSATHAEVCAVVCNGEGDPLGVVVHRAECVPIGVEVLRGWSSFSLVILNSYLL